MINKLSSSSILPDECPHDTINRARRMAEWNTTGYAKHDILSRDREEVNSKGGRGRSVGWHEI